MRRSLGCLLAAAAVLVAACGTTVPRANTVRIADSEFGPAPTTDNADSQSPDAPTPDTPVIDGAAGAPRSTRATSRSGADAGPVTAAVGRGLTTTTLTVGWPVASGTDALAAALGLSGAEQIPGKDLIAAVVDDVNRSGGVLGRKLAVYIHDFDGTAYVSNPSQTFSEICTDFRDDHKVFAVIFNIADPTVRKCLADMGSPLIVSGSSALTAAAYNENGANYLFGINSITVGRLAELFIRSLMERSFTTKWDTTAGRAGGIAPVKLGLIHVDNPDTNALYAAYAKELAKYGLKFDETVTYAYSLQAGIAATSAAIYRFRSQGVTHVFGASGFFLQAAEQQHYRPRYAYLPGLGDFGVQNVPAEQMNGALTVGWAPATDVAAAQDPGTPGGKHCEAVMRAHSLVATQRTDLERMHAICDAIYAFRDALNRGNSANVAGLRRGYEALGTSFTTALTFGASMGPNRHNGVDSVRDMAFDNGCSCLVYTSKTDRR